MNEPRLIGLSLSLQSIHETSLCITLLSFFFLFPSLSLSLHDPLPLSNRTDISRKFLTRVLRKTVSAFPCFDFARKAMEREWRVRGGQILSRGLTAGYGLKGVKCYYCKGYVCGREY